MPVICTIRARHNPITAPTITAINIKVIDNPPPETTLSMVVSWMTTAPVAMIAIAMPMTP